ncbi:hydantoinase/oxoprolinase N-terminal domain-containing protein [Desulfoplanes formicivorans]|uniref:Hydantoinase/oxoprolinase n=1 Tax=Desulfoplanes formicivorans TaxID=1592317 RepID=A0A194AJ40_9BACT|nr:hydantoinase/oxoprolinase family protein [Desulfoplanes formicivorans]GAU09348.1 hydantoinase/oxoprolinase [Desulfoplanes formicivorans]
MTTTSSCIIGVDAGGTYTDAVIMDRATRTVLASVKVPTTHANPGIGIVHGIRQLLAKGTIPVTSIARTVISTTLGTNALVEGKGADVGLFVIGFNQRLDVPAEDMRYIPGGHKAKGIEREPLGLEELYDGIKAMKGHVQAYGISSLMSFADPSHELVAAKALSLLDDKPVFCSHQASTRPGMKERATTALLNAKLLPIMQTFVQGVRTALHELGVQGDVCMVCGDCTEIELDRAIRQSASTFASGPAATAWFGSHIASTDTALVVDMGGTTTDITMVAGGKPVMDTTGMTIGQWQTHVQAVEMFTVGVGGDSLFTPLGIDNNTLGPSRVIPLCQADQYVSPQDVAHLTDAIQQLGPKLKSSLVIVPDPASPPHSPLVAWLRDQGPTTSETILQHMGQGEIALERELGQLLKTRSIVQTGFTPTDALHCLQHIAIGNTDLAMLGARVLGTCLDMDPVTLSNHVLSLARDKIATTILQYVAGREVNQGLSSFLHTNDNPLLEITVRLKPPIIGIGACSRYVLPEVAEQLGTTIVFPDNFDVGNAVGAAWLGLDKGNP